MAAWITYGQMGIPAREERASSVCFLERLQQPFLRTTIAYTSTVPDINSAAMCALYCAVLKSVLAMLSSTISLH